MNDAPETRLSLIGRLQNREDADAWTEFVQIYEPLIRAIVRKRGMQYADAAEVTQEVLARVANSIASWNPDPKRGSFRGWLYRVTRNLTIDHVRRAKNLPTDGGEIDLDQLAQPSEDESREFRLEYKRQLFHWAAGKVQKSFKPVNWQAFWLTAVEEQSVEDVSRKLKISRGRVCVNRFRVMNRIASVIEKRMDETAGH